MLRGPCPRSSGKRRKRFLCLSLAPVPGEGTAPGIAFALGKALVPRRFRSAANTEANTEGAER